jgi:hypothetical protein
LDQFSSPTQALDEYSVLQWVPIFRHLAAWHNRPGYNLPMARGWESKAVEDQQAEAAATTNPNKVRLAPEEVAKEKQQQGLLLSRKRVLQQLQAAQNPIHRNMLEAALGELDAQLARLG